MKRLVALVIAILPSAVHAQEAAPAPAPVVVPTTPTPAPARPRLIGVILTGAQALLWDEQRGEYALKKVGDELAGGRIIGLEMDRVIIESNGVREAIEMAPAPGAKSLKRARRMPALIVGAPQEEPTQASLGRGPSSPQYPLGAFAAAATAETPPAPQVLQAPTAPAAPAPAIAIATAPPAPLPPAMAVAPPAPAQMISVAPPPPVTAAPAPVPSVVVAPPAPPAPPVAVAPVPPAPPPVPVAASPAPPVVVAPPAPPAPPIAVAPAPPPVPAAPAIAPTGSVPPVEPLAPPATPERVTVDGPPPSPDSPVIVIPRSVLDQELQDFAALSDQVSLARAPRGGFQLTRIQRGSFADRIGLAAGDVVLRIDGRPINGLEDASAAYAWLRVTERFNVDVVRNGRPIRLRYVVTGAVTARR
jgi:type II secretory pathway component PulC